MYIVYTGNNKYYILLLLLAILFNNAIAITPSMAEDNSLAMEIFVKGRVVLEDEAGVWEISDSYRMKLALSPMNETHYKINIEDVYIDVNTDEGALERIFFFIDQSKLVSDENVLKNNLIKGYESLGVVPKLKYIAERSVKYSYPGYFYNEASNVMPYLPLALPSILVKTMLVYPEQDKKVPATAHMLAYLLILHDEGFLDIEELATALTYSASRQNNLTLEGIGVYSGVPVELYSARLFILRFVESPRENTAFREDVVFESKLLTLSPSLLYHYNPIAYNIKASAVFSSDSGVVRKYTVELSGYTVADYSRLYNAPVMKLYSIVGNGEEAFIPIVSWSSSSKTTIEYVPNYLGSNVLVLYIKDLAREPLLVTSIYPVDLLAGNKDFGIPIPAPKGYYILNTYDEPIMLNNNAIRYLSVSIDNADNVTIVLINVDAIKTGSVDEIDLTTNTIDLASLKTTSELVRREIASIKDGSATVVEQETTTTTQGGVSPQPTSPAGGGGGETTTIQTQPPQQTTSPFTQPPATENIPSGGETTTEESPEMPEMPMEPHFDIMEWLGKYMFLVAVTIVVVLVIVALVLVFALRKS